MKSIKFSQQKFMKKLRRFKRYRVFSGYNKFIIKKFRRKKNKMNRNYHVSYVKLSLNPPALYTQFVWYKKIKKSFLIKIDVYFY